MSLKLIKGYRCFIIKQETFLIAKYWLVPESDLRVIYVSKTLTNAGI